MRLPAAIINALAIADSAWSSVKGVSAHSYSTLVSTVMLGAEKKHLDSVCAPPGANSTLDLSFPCNQRSILLTQCYYGHTFSEVWNQTGGDFSVNKSWTPQSLLNQRLCTCESEYFDALAGCSSCYKAHGAGIVFIDETAISSISSSYCAVSSTPTVGVGNMLAEYYKNPNVSSRLNSELSTATTSTYSDPLLGSTAVSYYYTPSVTGTAVFNIAGVTHGAKPTATNVVKGQITADSGAGAVGSGLVGLKRAVAAVLALMTFMVLL